MGVCESIINPNDPNNSTIKMKSKKIRKRKKTKQKNIENPLKLTNDVIITRNQKNPELIYIKKKVLGKGSFGKVWLVHNKELEKYFAMKIIKKTTASNLKDSEIMNEISILKSLDHPKILKILDFYSTSNLYYIITEYCPEGELYNEIIKKGKFDEGKTAFIMNQLFKAILYLHSNNIIHRDLKPDNIMITKREKNNCLQVKLIDFGTAKIFKKNQNHYNYVGSSYYIAPEILNRKYNEKCDIWSCGVIMYILLSGKPPFDGNNDQEVLDKIKLGKYNLDIFPFNKLSNECIDLIKKLLTYDPNQRINASEALNHNWFNRKEFINENIVNIIDKDLAFQMIKNMQNYNKHDNILYCAVLAYLVHHNSNEKECIEAGKLFNILDLNNNGKIEKNELKKGMMEYWKLSKEEIDQEIDIIYENIDTDHNGYIEYEEFIRAAVNPKIFLSQNYLKFAFKYFDVDKNGFITFDEIKTRFMQNANNHSEDVERELKDIYNNIDCNHDGNVSFEDFCQMMNNILNK